MMSTTENFVRAFQEYENSLKMRSSLTATTAEEKEKKLEEAEIKLKQALKEVIAEL